MAPTYRILTLHPDVGLPAQLALLDAIEYALLDQRASRVWLDPSARPDLVVLAEFDEH